ncbi:MAG: 5-oxoprolinase subunit PxpA [Halieaceae bacterium]|jgi:UPF0271 protein|nr:5-oxoprolinase subunit PxpA [Halieaceae bacterium]
MQRTLTLNCDLGESFGAWIMGNDAAVMPLIDAANIACGFHAGDASIMRETIALAVQHTVEIGAHVSYPDLQGFGRRSMAIRGQALEDLIHYQLSALAGLAQLQGTDVTYIKPHGALYNDMASDLALMEDVMRAVAAWPRPIDLMTMATPERDAIEDLAAQYGIGLRFEAFADRAYTDEGLLVPRSEPGAVLDATAAAEQAAAIAAKRLLSQNGKPLRIDADTLCVHGDSPDALSTLRLIRSSLLAN